MKQLLLNTLHGRFSLALLTLILPVMACLSAGVLYAAQADEDGGYDYSAQSLRTALWLDKTEDEIYQKGEYQTVGFQTNEDAYAVIYRVDAEGLVSVLWPRSRYDDGFVFGGHEYLLPVSGSNRLRVSHQEGEGFVEAIVSRYAFDLRDLAIDFHHEQDAEIHDFYVAGDPFLALNEINFAVTGLEESADYVITDYQSYYVHQEVEHPRYLCVQCHDETEVTYSPYHDTCTLDISYDYGWYNSWYGRYGYYPIYSQPVYVYVDPWSYNPWVNFWYTPYYTCAPAPYYNWGYSTYCWNDSPYYYGNSSVRYKDGSGRYRSLGKPAYNSRKGARSSNNVTRLVRGTPSGDARSAMRTKTPAVGSSRSSVRADGNGKGRGSETQISDSRFRGEDRIARSRTKYDKPVTRTGQSGLRIRTPDSSTSSRSRNEGSRHISSGKDGQRRTTSTPVGIERTHINRGLSAPHQPVQGSYNKPAKQDSRSNSTIRPVEPRQKGTRVWNNSSRSGSSNTGNKPAQVRPGQRENNGSRTGKQPERIKPRSDSRSKSSVKAPPKKKSSSSSSSTRSSSKTTSGSKSRSSSVQKSSSNSGGSSATRSSGGSTTRSSSGSSRSSGGRSSQKR